MLLNNLLNYVFNVCAWNMVSVNSTLFIYLNYYVYIYIQNYQDPLEAVLGKSLMTKFSEIRVIYIYIMVKIPINLTL